MWEEMAEARGIAIVRSGRTIGVQLEGMHGYFAYLERGDRR